MSLIATWHPTFAYFHNPWEWGAFEVDLDRFSRLIHGKLEALPTKEQLITNPTWKTVRKLVAWCMRHHEPLVLDIETLPEMGADSDERYTGKDPLRCQLQLVGIGCSKWGLSHKWTDGSLQIEREIRKHLQDHSLRKLLQNGDWFDLRVMKRYGVHVEPVDDIREQRRVLSSTAPLRLDHQGSIATDYIPWKADHQNAKDEKGYVFTTDITEKKIYNVHDCIVTARCHKVWNQDPEWGTRRVQKLYEHQRRLGQIAAGMNSTGIQVDKIQRYFMAWALKEAYIEKQAKVIEAVGLENWRPTPPNMRALIFKKHVTGKYQGRFNLPDPFDPAMYVDPKEMTTIGVADEQLTLLLIDSETPKELKQIIELYWDAEKTWKQRSTYVASKEVSEAIDSRYRMHANWNSCGADTGRFSGFLMVIPKPLRSMYTADPNCVLVGADYRQMELRVMFAVTGDRKLGEGIAKGNVYVEEAKEYFNLPDFFTKKPDGKPFDPTKHIKPEAYKVTKNTRLGAQYGSGKKMFFSQLIGMDRSIQYDLAMQMREKFLLRAADTVAWWEQETDRVINCGYSESRIMHRRRVYPRPPERPEIANYPIQSTAADVKNIAMIKIDDAIKKYKMKSRIIIDLHDAIYTNTPIKEEKQMREIFIECMEAEYTIQGHKFSFPVDMESHQRWSDFG